MRDWGVESRKLIAYVSVSRSELKQSDENHPGSVCDLRGMASSGRAALFADTPWEPAISLEFTYERVNVAEPEQEDESRDKDD